MINTSVIQRLFFLFCLGFAGWSQAADEIYADKDGVANKGYDVVAYFSLEPGADAVKGDEAFSTQHNGYTYHFANQANLDAFTQSPDAYLPQYGGYCAFGVAHAEKKVKIDPDQWAVVDGKLYLNVNGFTQKRWLEDRDDNITVANKLWPSIQDEKFSRGWF